MIEIICLNVRGLNKEEKRRNLFKTLKCDHRFQKYNLICLVETKLHEEDHDLIFKMWNAPCFFSSAGGFAGVAILTRNFPTSDILDSWIDPGGRMVQITISWNDLPIAITAVYAPSETLDRPAFFDSMIETLPENDEICMNLLIGDFNCLADPALDKRGGDPTSGSTGFPNLLSVLTDMDLEDLWRIRNPDKKTFSREGNTRDGLVRTRIDNCYSSTLLRPYIQSIDYLEFPLENLDHKAIFISLSDPDTLPPGKGYWKLNTSLLQNKWFVKKMRDFLSERAPSLLSHPNPLLWWEETKADTRILAIKLSKVIDAQAKKKDKELQKELENAKSFLDDFPSFRPFQEDYEEVKRKISRVEKEKLDRLILFSNAKFLFAQETPSKNLKMIKSLSTKFASIPSLRHPTIGPTKNPANMLEAASLFYQDLYKQPPSDRTVTEAQDQILALWANVIPNGVSTCDGPITSQEAKTALFSSSKKKTPGIDGLPVEFYVQFWDVLQTPLTAVFNSVLDNPLPSSMSTAVISIIYKKGDPLDVANYRPISVLSHDVKLLAKVLISRLHAVIPHVVHPDQTGVKGRYIGEPIRQFLDTCEYLNIHRKKAIILLLDQKKAFDLVSWDFLHRILEHIGLSPFFRQLIRRLYENPSAHIKLNNHLSLPFPLFCGVRQGCPLSPVLYSLTIEAFANAMRTNPHIKGILLPPEISRDRELLSLFLDDTTMHLADEQDLNEAKKVCRLYCLASNASFNWNKSEGILINVKQPPRDPAFDIKWLAPNEEFRFLGIHLKNSLPFDLSVPWSRNLISFADSLKRASWTFSLKGRVTFLNTYAMSRLYFVGSFIPLPTAEEHQLQSLIWKFIWRGARTGKVRREYMVLPVVLGGLHVPQVGISIQSLHIKWISRLLALPSDSNRPWAALAKYFLENLYCDFGLQLHVLHFRPTETPNNLIPPFWRSALEGWWKIIKPQGHTSFSKEQILSTPLFLNPIIKFKDPSLNRKRFLALASWGLSKVRDLWNDGQWMTATDISRDYHLRIPQQLVDSIIAALPQEWQITLAEPWQHHEGTWALATTPAIFHVFSVDTFSRGRSLAKEYYGPLPLPPHAFDSEGFVDITHMEYLRPVAVHQNNLLFLDNKPCSPELLTPFSSLNNSQIRLQLETPGFCPSGNFITWNHDLDYTLPWRQMLARLWKVHVSRKFNETYFLLLHRGLPHGDRARKHKLNYPPNADCLICNTPETLLHIFFSCNTASTIWTALKRTWKNASGLPPPIDAASVLSGFLSSPPAPVSSPLFSLLQVLHRCAVHVLWRAACARHHGEIQHPSEHLATYVLSVKSTLSALATDRTSKIAEAASQLGLL